MQIDFHHAVTYVAARLGGMPHDQASTVAHAAQYVDDATCDGPLQFDSGERYVRVTSSHKMLNLTNAEKADNRLVWLPFHFLPGNAAPPPGCTPEEAFQYRLICKPDSEVARAMVADCIRRRDLPFALHRFGVALHTYVDTWAHQQFVGGVCDLNDLAEVGVNDDSAYNASPAYAAMTGFRQKLANYLADFLPVGHAAATTFPDLPFIRWHFTRKNGETVQRDNPTDFLAAAGGAFNMVRRYVAGDEKLADVALPPADAAAIDSLLRGTQEIDGEARHQTWIAAIAKGTFSFGAAQITYASQGPTSWKMLALGKDPQDPEAEEDETFTFTPGFLTSDWKRFHDAVQYQRLFVLHDLLPRFGLCAS
ncbi:hypothetical protein WK57_32235 [Burkholderia ubonensis]|uniref:Uncharacterized protein n=1 Tax=Burkholderia ubonensis TaxID=101571 RepID=A0AA40R5N9_9BURK|nr:DUF6765 family protein [Burkholderia ubonensis]KWZ53619.1 hypothetical protein WK57_32235 [Burkholderia ubonensis]